MLSNFSILSEERVESGCYPIEIFLDPGVAKKTCPIGYGVFNNAVFDKYGYTYCEFCIHRWLDTKLECPLNKQRLTRADIIINRTMRDEIEEANIICIYSKRGCQWSGNLKELQGHINSDCTSVKMLCISCQNSFFRKEIELHYNSCSERVIRCEFCEIPYKKKDSKVNTVFHFFLTHKCLYQLHIVLCKENPRQCENECGRLIPSKLMQAHLLRDCTRRSTECQFALVGCTQKVILYFSREKKSKLFKYLIDFAERPTNSLIS